MIKGYFKRKSPESGKSEENEWELPGSYKSLDDLQKAMIRGDRNIILITDPNVEPMRVIIRYDNYFDQNPGNTLELYNYRFTKKRR